MAARWAAAYRPPVHDLYELSLAHTRGSAAIYRGLSENVSPPRGARAAVWDGPEQSPSVDSCPAGGPPGDAARPGGCPHPVRAGVGAAPRGGRGGRACYARADPGTTDPS